MKQTKAFSIFILAMSLFFAAYVSYSGYVVVKDRTGMVETASVVGFHGGSKLYRLPGGNYVGIPPYEGRIEVKCRDGSQVKAGIATPGSGTNVSVVGEGTCARVV